MNKIKMLIIIISLLLFSNSAYSLAVKSQLQKSFNVIDVSFAINKIIMSGKRDFQEYIDYLAGREERIHVKNIKFFCIWGSEDLESIDKSIEYYFTHLYKKTKIVIISGGCGSGRSFFNTALLMKHGIFDPFATEAKGIRELFERYMKKNKIKNDISFFLDYNASNTFENAKFTKKICDENGFKPNKKNFVLAQYPVNRRGINSFDKIFGFKPITYNLRVHFELLPDEALRLELPLILRDSDVVLDHVKLCKKRDQELLKGLIYEEFFKLMAYADKGDISKDKSLLLAEIVSTLKAERAKKEMITENQKLSINA